MTSVSNIELNETYEQDAPSATQRIQTAKLDADHRTIQQWINEELLPALALVIRDDDTLVDALVRYRNLHPEVVSLLASRASWQPKQAVACATTANITLSGEQNIDGVATSISRVLVKAQTDASQNGIYVSGAGAWTRATDADGGTELDAAFVFVTGGTAHGSTSWVATSSGYTIGTSSITFAQVAGYPSPLPEISGGTGKTSLGAGTILASGSSAARSLASRFGETKNARDYGAVGDGIVDDTAAVAAAIAAASAAGGGLVVLFGKFRITSQITVPARVKLLGAGSLTSDAATRSPSTIIKDFNGVGVLFSGDDSGPDGIHYDSAAARTGDLVQVTGSRWNAPSLAVTNAGQDGLRIGATEAGASSINANLWSIGFIAALSNGRYGINIDHTNTTTSGSFPAGAPDCNAGALVRADVRGNTSDGIRFGNTIDNWCGMLCVQSNTGYGIRFAAYARNNIISKSYTEGNTAGEGIIDSLATQNVVWAARAITLTAGWTNNGSASNAIFQHQDAVGDGDFNNAPWYWPGDFNQAGLPIGSVTRHRQYVSANYNYGEWRTETDGTDGTKVVINTRKTGVGQRDVLATDEDGRVFVKIAGASLVLGPDAANYAQVFSGFGTPEGVVTAERGSLFLRMNGAAGTCMYVKESGSGNTGWVAK